MFVRADTVLSQVDLETVTPEEALSITPQLPANILHSAHFTYYEGLFRAPALVAEAALWNREKQGGRKEILI